MTPSQELLDAVARKADKYGLDYARLCAQVETESSWNPKATRFEPAFLKRYVEPLGFPVQEAQDRATSWGLLQVMGQVAREFGFKGAFEDLLDPETGLEWGCRKLKQCIRLASQKGEEGVLGVEKALLYYNGGGDKEYPKRVLAKVEKYPAGQVITNMEQLGEA